MKAKTQKFEAVKFMRERREELSRLQSEHPQEYNKKLEEIREKYPEKFVKRKRNEA
jgi:hypothetical protein